MFRYILCSALLTFSTALAAPPHILLIVADDLGWNDVGFNGGTRIPTPHLDQLAADGVRLTDFRSCPMCTPTRAGLLTGRYPHRFGMMRAVVPPWSTYGLPKAEQTLPELLDASTYTHRGIVGKWHLGHTTPAHLPNQHGFTRFFGHYNGAIDYFTHEREGELDWHDNKTPIRETGHATPLLADRAVQFIASAPSDKPWFLYVPFNAPHSPLQAEADDLERFASIKNKRARIYAAMVHGMDRAIGRILQAVDDKGASDNTLVWFFSDNGGIPAYASNAPWRKGKLTVYEGGTRVAAALRWPEGGLKGGRTFSERCGYIDVAPTVLSMTQTTAPKNLDGINLLPSLTRGAAIPDRPWFSWMDQNESAHASIHLGPWKLIRHGSVFSPLPADRKGVELYHLDNDPGEQTNLAARHPDRVTELNNHLQKFGAQRQAGVSAYRSGREGFVAPKDWIIE